MNRTKSATSVPEKKGLRWYVPLLAGLAAYAVAPFGGLVWDDQLLRQQIVAYHSLGDVLKPPAGIPQWTYAYYRPLTTLSYIADARLFGQVATAGPHLANVAYHLLTTFFVWRLLRRLLAQLPGADISAVAVAVLFAVHPIHTESVSWITGRSDLLATLFLVPALLAALHWRDRDSHWALVLSPALFLLALLTKEVALAGLVILPLVIAVGGPQHVAVNADGSVEGIRRAIPADRALAAASMLLCWIGATWGYFALRGAGGTLSPTFPAFSMDLIWTLLSACGWYLIKLLVPWPQSNFVTVDMLPATGLSVAVMLMAAGAFAASIRHWRICGDGTAFVGLTWLFAALAPSLAAILTGVSETPVAERYLYLPSVGAALALGPPLCHLLTARWARPASWSNGLLATAYLVTAVQRGTVWSNDLRLWTDTTRQMPAHGLPWLALGKARFDAGDRQGALEALQRARDLQDDPLGRAIALYNLGAIMIQDGNLEQAAQNFAAAVQADPSYAQGHYGLGRVFYERATRPGQSWLHDPQRLDLLHRGERELDAALARDPTSVPTHLVLAMLHAAKGDVLLRGNDRAAAGSSYAQTIADLDAVASIDPAVAANAEVQAIRQRATLALRQAQRP